MTGRRVVEVPAPDRRPSWWRRLLPEDPGVAADARGDFLLAVGLIVLGSLYWSLAWSEPRVVSVPGPVVTVTVTATPTPTPTPSRR